MSSGAPSTQQVDTALSTALSRLDGYMLDQAHRVDPRDKAEAIAVDFASVVPGVGYRSLAALARTRRVTVLALNWDLAAEDAAEIVGVPCLSYDVFDEASWPVELPARGLVVPHLHGTVDSPRHGRGEKPRLSDAAIEHLSRLHAGGRLLVAAPLLMRTTTLETFSHGSSPARTPLVLGDSSGTQRPTQLFGIETPFPAFPRC
jgi:hypothetical protein